MTNAELIAQAREMAHSDEWAPNAESDAMLLALADALESGLERIKWFEASGGVAVHSRMFTVMAEADRLRTLCREAAGWIADFTPLDDEVDSSGAGRHLLARLRAAGGDQNSGG